MPGEMTGYYAVPGMTAGADLSAKQYHFVKLDSTAFQVVAMTNANAETPFGCLQDDPAASGRPADVAVFGVVKAEYGGTISVADKLACNNDGEVIADAELTDGSASDLHHIGVALESGVDGDIKRILIHNADRIGSE